MTDKKPLVSIVIPCYNHAQFVQETIQSIIDQDYKNLELIIIDDGSKDNSVEKIQEMISACKKRFVRFEFRCRPNKGLCATLNEALEWCKGEYFSPIASDDIALPHKTDFLLKKHKEFKAAVVFGSAKQFNNTQDNDLLLNCEHTENDLMFMRNIPLAPASLMRTETIRNVGGFFEDTALEDLYMWLKLTSNGEKLYSFPEIVVKYRDHDSNTTKQFNFMHEQRLKVLELFCFSPNYNEARRNALVIGAKAIANEEIKTPLKIVYKEKMYDFHGLIIIIKAFTPNRVIRILKKIIS